MVTNVSGSRSRRSNGYHACHWTQDRGFKPGQGRCTVKAINIRSMTFFEGEIKPSAPCRKILRHVKDPASMIQILRRQNSATIFSPNFSCFATNVCARNCERAVVDESGILRTQMGTHNRSEMVALKGSPCVPTH
jgi:hypothetical protein